MKLKAFLNLIRWQNLTMLIGIQLLLKCILFKNYNIPTTLNNYEFLLLVLSTITIAAGGYIINDIFDTQTDAINKPDKVYIGPVFKRYNAIICYLTLTTVGISLGIYISLNINIPLASIVFITIALLLFLYSFALKKIALIGNIVISLMIGFSIFIVGLIDIVPRLDETNGIQQVHILKIVVVFSLFSFGLNLIRELIKDIEDIGGDYAAGMKTLPILIGRKRAKNIAVALSSIFLLSFIVILASSQSISTYVFVYGFILIVLPLLYFCYKLYFATTTTDFKKLSRILKIIMLLAMLSLVLI